MSTITQQGSALTVGGRIINMYKNNDPTYGSRKILIHPRLYKNFNLFLDEITSNLRSMHAITKVFSSDGQPVEKMDEFEHNKYYVAVPNRENFKLLDYPRIANEFVKRQRGSGTSSQVINQPTGTGYTSNLNIEAKYHDYEYPVKIFVYRNGDVWTPAKRFCFLSKHMLDWDKTLQYMSDEMMLVTGCLITLYTMDGIEVDGPEMLDSFECYIAVGNHDRLQLNLPYGVIPEEGQEGDNNYQGSKDAGAYRQKMPGIDSSRNMQESEPASEREFSTGPSVRKHSPEREPQQPQRQQPQRQQQQMQQQRQPPQRQQQMQQQPPQRQQQQPPQRQYPMQQQPPQRQQQQQPPQRQQQQPPQRPVKFVFKDDGRQNQRSKTPIETAISTPAGSQRGF